MRAEIEVDGDDLTVSINENGELEVESTQDKKSSTYVFVIVLGIAILGFTAVTGYFINKVRKMHITEEELTPVSEIPQKDEIDNSNVELENIEDSNAKMVID